MLQFITLTADQMELCRKRGEARHINAEKSKRKPVNGFKESSIDTNILGCCGEMAFAVRYGIKDFIPSEGTYKSEPDVPPNFEVRTSDLPHASLIVRRTDKDTDLAVLVIQITSDIYLPFPPVPVHEVKKDEYKRNPKGQNPAWWYSQSDILRYHGMIE